MTRRVAALLALGLLAVITAPTAPAPAATTHHATVVVQLPDGSVESRRITFTDDFVSGIEALTTAGLEPVTYGQGPLGTAVCQILSFGCPSDSSCLTCGGEAYWSYWRAPSGTDKFIYSSVGAGATEVHDGDVEGWRWGNGNLPPPLPRTAPPPTAPPPTTTSATTAPASSIPRVTGTATTAPNNGDGSGVVSPPSDTRASQAATASTTTSTPSRAAQTSKSPAHAGTSPASPGGTSDGRALAAAPSADESSGGTWVGMGLFAVIAAGLIAWLVIAHGRRRTNT